MKDKPLFFFIIGGFFAIFCYFFYFSANSLKNINKLNQTIDRLEQDITKLKKENQYLKNKLEASGLKAKKEYLNQRGFVNSNEVLVDIEVPAQIKIESTTKKPTNILLLIIVLGSLITWFVYYLYNKNKDKSKNELEKKELQ